MSHRPCGAIGITRLTADQKIPGSNPGRVVGFVFVEIIFSTVLSFFFSLPSIPQLGNIYWPFKYQRCVLSPVQYVEYNVQGHSKTDGAARRRRPLPTSPVFVSSPHIASLRVLSPRLHRRPASLSHPSSHPADSPRGQSIPGSLLSTVITFASPQLPPPHTHTHRPVWLLVAVYNTTIPGWHIFIVKFNRRWYFEGDGDDSVCNCPYCGLISLPCSRTRLHFFLHLNVLKVFG